MPSGDNKSGIDINAMNNILKDYAKKSDLKDILTRLDNLESDHKDLSSKQDSTEKSLDR